MTLAQAAKRLGVSTATVSNAFNRPGQLSKELRESILEQCHQLGYPGPGATGRIRRVERTGIIGVLLSNYLKYSFSDPLANQFLEGISEIFEREEYSLLLMPARDHVRLAQGFEAFVEGFIIYGRPQIERARQLVSRGKGVITVDFTLDGCPSVNIDNYAAARQCAEHALSRPRTRIGIIGLRLTETDAIEEIGKDAVLFPADTITIQRLWGFRDAVNNAGVDASSCRILHVQDNTHDLGYEAARRLLEAADRPDLLLCMSDMLAIGASAAARDLGLSVPGGVAITGFDDIPQAATQMPPLTTVHQRSREKGRTAAEMFLGLREEAAVTLPTDLVVRESCP